MIVDAPRTEDAHRLLGALLESALADERIEIELGAVAPALWQALGLRPRPAFFVQMAMRIDRSEPLAPPVREAPAIEVVDLLPLAGRVLGPGGTGLADAHVALPALQATSRTDRRGRFRFGALPSEGGALAVEVSARGRTMTTNVRRPPGGQPLIIRFKPAEA